MGVALLVVEHRPLLNRFFGDGQVNGDLAVGIRRRGFHRQFQGIEQAAGIAAGHIEQVVGGGVADRDRAVAVAHLGILKGPLEQLAQVRSLEGLEPKQARAAHQRLVDFKKWVFGGGTDQRDGAVLDPGEQGVLLGTVETVHLIDEQGGAQAMALEPLLGGVHG